MFNKDFIPAVIWVNEFLKETNEMFSITIERENGITEKYETRINSRDIKTSCFYIERTVKTLLWMYGGFRLYLDGNDEICSYIRNVYKKNGARSFDVNFMENIYNREFEVYTHDGVPDIKRGQNRISVNSGGNRIGLDIGGSFIKVCAVSGDELVYQNRIPWQPVDKGDISYHINKITDAIGQASMSLPYVDRIGVSSAGVHIDNTTRVASVFCRVTDKESIKTVYQNAAGDIPVVVVNDGDTAALCGTMYGADGAILGISIGTSEAAGYIDRGGNITGRLNEFAFVPIDFSENGLQDSWSGDIGCGVNYLSQSGVLSLARAAGISFPPDKTSSERCYMVQELVCGGFEPAVEVYRTLGEYLGYSIAYYRLFYDFDFIMLAGGVVSGEEKEIVKRSALDVLKSTLAHMHIEFIETEDTEDSYMKQAITAASLKSI